MPVFGAHWVVLPIAVWSPSPPSEGGCGGVYMQDGEQMMTDNRATTVRARPGNDWDAEFATLYKKHQPKLLTYAERRNALDAELVVDNALFDLYRAKDRLRSNNAKVYWAYLYRAVDSHLARERGRDVPDPTSEVEDLEDTESFEEQLIDQLNFDDTMQMLTPNQASALRLQLVDGMTSAQAGDVLGKTPTATRQLQHQAVSRLRWLLYGLTVVAVVAGALAVLLAGSPSVVENSPIDAPVESPPTSTSVERSLDAGETDGEGQSLRVIERSGLLSADDDRLDPAPGAIPSAVPGEVGVLIVNLGSGRCLDVGDPDRLIQWTCHGDSQQRFVVTPIDDDRRIVLRLAASDLCLAVVGGSVGTTDCDGTDAQVFQWVDSTLRTGQGSCLTVDGGSIEGGALANKASIVPRRCDGSDAQKFVDTNDVPEPADPVWAPDPPSSELMIKNVGSQLCVDFPGADESSMIQFTCHDGNQQRFHQVAVGDGFALQLVGNGLCLDALLTELRAAPCTGEPHQMFTWSGQSLLVQDTSDCVAVESDSANQRPHARIVVASCDGTAAQQFVTASRLIEGQSAEDTVPALVTRILAA